MERTQHALAPFSSDEYANSGEDSDEDVVTDYTNPNCNHASCLTGMSLCAGNAVDSDYAKDNAVIKMSNNERTDGQASQGGSGMQQQPQHQTNPLVPIISVTPHSPGISNKYLILEDNLQHLHDIQDVLQRLREETILKTGQNSRNISQRMSSSCPSLSQRAALREGVSDCYDQDEESDPDLITSTNSSPAHYPLTAHSQNSQAIDRRRSWADLEDARNNHRKNSVQNHLQAQNMQRHSISLGSLNSDMGGNEDTEIGTRANRSQTSTQSLNEADFVQNDLIKVATKRVNQKHEKSSGLMPGIAGPRLPLQKSISTPSIVIPPVNNAEAGTQAVSSLSAGHETHEKGSESETETDDIHIPQDHEFPDDLLRVTTTLNTQNTYDELLTDTGYDDQHVNKGKKRGSLFFSRKKKDKSGKKIQQSQHQWSTSVQTNSICESCMKSIGTKHVLHCDGCGATIHQLQSCKDQFHGDCTKTKSHSNKDVSKSNSTASMMSNSSHVKRASTSSLPIPSMSASGRDANAKKPVVCYSPWRRVAAKLGVNQTINEEKDGDGPLQSRELSSGVEDLDYGDDGHAHQQLQFINVDLNEFDSDLGLNKEEPDSWSAAIGGRNIALRLVDKNEREIKRQEHIYEFILTEKHHCLVLLAMDKIFAEGVHHYFQMSNQIIDRVFPQLRELIDIHLGFLLKLRKRQAEGKLVSTIADILVDQFSSTNSDRLKKSYGEFCSRHREAVNTCKTHLMRDPNFAQFVRNCQASPLLKKKGIPECILFVTQRLTKYPLLIEPLIKTGNEGDESDTLRLALAFVKDILNEVDACVANKERKDRKLEIYNKIDAKSFAIYRGNKFKKSNIIRDNCDLKFEGTANLMQGRGKSATVNVIVFTDVLIFLVEKDQKYSFFVPDNKAGVVSLQKLLVREKADQKESRGIYLISSSPNDPEMFELKVLKPKDTHVWIQAIRAAVEACPQDSDTISTNNGASDSRSSSISNPEDRLRIAKAKETHIQKILGELKKKDTEHAHLLEQKMELQAKLLQTAGVYDKSESDSGIVDTDLEKHVPDYTKYVRGEHGFDSAQLWNEVVIAVQTATRLVSSLSCNGGATLSRSVSSVGEHHSQAYIAPSLSVPRRAETFAGFDYNKKSLMERVRCRYQNRSSLNSKKKLPQNSLNRPAQAESSKLTEKIAWRDTSSNNGVTKHKEQSEHYREEKEIEVESATSDETIMDGKIPQEAALEVSSHIYTLLCIISNLMTTIDSLNAKFAMYQENHSNRSSIGSVFGSSGSIFGSSGRPNTKCPLEELRNLQDQFSRDKEAFRITMSNERSQIEEEKLELQRQKEQLLAEQRDVALQREQLFRRFEAYERQGLVTMHSPSSGSQQPSSLSQSEAATATQQPHQARTLNKSSSKSIPLNLISATNQQFKQVQKLPVKQQLPLKLASASSNSNTTSSNNNLRSAAGNNNNNASSNSPDRHFRSGSSPVIMTSATSGGSSSSLYTSSPDHAAYNLNNGNLSQFHASTRSLQSNASTLLAAPEAPQQKAARPEPTLDEEVIFF